jgi:hypothetical protein
LKKGVIVVNDNNSISTYQALHRFVLKLLPAKPSATELSVSWNGYIAQLGSAVRQFDKLQLFKMDLSKLYGKGTGLSKLEEAQQTLDKLKEKIKADVKISQKDKDAMSMQIALIAGNLHKLTNEQDLESILKELTVLVSKDKVTKGNLVDLVDQIDTILAQQVSSDELQIASNATIDMVGLGMDSGLDHSVISD